MIKDSSCIIDTFQIKTKLGNLYNPNISKEEYTYIVKRIKHNLSNATATIPLSLNRRKGEHSRIESLSEHKQAFDEVIEELGVLDKSEIEINRVDIAVDLNIDFHNNFKYLLYMFEIASFSKNNSEAKSDKWYTTSLETLKNNTIKHMARRKEIVFYDKKAESKGEYPYTTRLEFRFKEVSSEEFIKPFDRLEAIIESMINNFDKVNDSMRGRIIKFYSQERDNRSVKSLSEFVRKYNDYIYTREIMQGLYDYDDARRCVESNRMYSNTRSFDNWLKGFRKSNKLNLYKKSDILNFQKDFLRAIKDFQER